MAISTRDGLIAAMASAQSVGPFMKSSITTVAGRSYSLFRQAGNPSSTLATPGAAGSALDRTSSGALLLPAASNTTYLCAFEGNLINPNTLVLTDRLVETGALSGTVTTAQTVNSTALPTRASGGAGVELWLEVYTALGATPSPTVTASYTNQAGTAGQTATLIGGIPASLAAGTSLRFQLAAGDTGVQSVQSVTSTTSTTTAGSFGIVLRKSVAWAVCAGNQASVNGFNLGYAQLGLPVVPDAACLELVIFAATTTSGIIQGRIAVAQG